MTLGVSRVGQVAPQQRTNACRWAMGDENFGRIVLKVAREDEVLRDDYAECFEGGAVGGDEWVREGTVIQAQR